MRKAAWFYFPEHQHFSEVLLLSLKTSLGNMLWLVLNHHSYSQDFRATDLPVD